MSERVLLRALLGLRVARVGRGRGRPLGRRLVLLAAALGRRLLVWRLLARLAAALRVFGRLLLLAALPFRRGRLGCKCKAMEMARTSMSTYSNGPSELFCTGSINA